MNFNKPRTGIGLLKSMPVQCIILVRFIEIYTKWADSRTGIFQGLWKRGLWKRIPPPPIYATGGDAERKYDLDHPYY